MTSVEALLFEENLLRDWKDHTLKPMLVEQRLRERLGRAMPDEHVLEVAGLATHVYGEHLGEWDEGLEYLEKLLESQSLGEKSLRRFKRQEAVLLKAQSPSRGLGELAEEDRFYVLTLALPAITLRRSAEEGLTCFLEAQELLTGDPGRRRLFAVITANLVCDLLERPELSREERTFLLTLAEKSHSLWVRSGSIADLERSTFRLIQAYQLCQRPQNYGSGRYSRHQWVKV